MEEMSLVSFIQRDLSDNWRDNILLTEENLWMSKWALRKDGYKFIKVRAKNWYNFPPRELYYLPSYPGEMRNIVESDSVIANELDEELESRISEGLKRYNRKIDPIVEPRSLTNGSASMGMDQENKVLVILFPVFPEVYKYNDI